MDQQVFDVTIREQMGKEAAKRLRANGFAPGVVYGRGMAPLPVAVDAREFARRFGHVAHSNVLVQLKLPEGQDGPLAMVQAVAWDPLTGALLSVDFHQVSLTEKIHATVSVTLAGEPAGHKQGGVLNQLLHQVSVACLPGDVPASLEIDVSGLDIGQSLHVSDLTLPAGVDLLSHAEEMLAVVTPPTKRTVEDEAEEAEPEPEQVPAKTEEAV